MGFIRRSFSSNWQANKYALINQSYLTFPILGLGI